MESFLGIDLGASSLKACLIDAGGVRRAISRAAITTTHPQSGYAEQDPQDWLSALEAALNDLQKQVGDLNDIKAISFSGGAHIAVLCDKRGAPLQPAIMWSDQRAQKQAADLSQNLEIEAISGNRPNPTWTLPQLLWLGEHRPHIIASTEKLFFAKDWLRFQLTGLHCSDTTEAVGGMLADKSGQWSPALQALSGLKETVWPPLHAPDEEAGRVTEQAARRFGLPQDVAVYQGAIDTSLEWLCAAPQSADMASLKLASAGVLAFASDKMESFAPVSFYPHIIAPWHYHAAGMSDCMGAIDWMRQTLTPQLSAAQFAEAAKKAAPGADGMMFYPYLSGARAPFWDSDLRAEIYGLTRGHGIEAIARAAYEGVGHVLTAIWHDMTARLNHTPKHMHVLGGGGQVGFFCQMLADMVNTELLAGEEGDCAFATALLAATAHGRFEDLTQAAQNAYRPLRQFTPDKDNHARYAFLHEQFIARHK